MTNWVPVMVPPMVLGAGVVEMWVFVGLVGFESCVVHSGFKVGELAERHDRHHAEGGGGYGTFWVLDWICGTEMKGGKKGRRRREKKGQEQGKATSAAVEMLTAARGNVACY